MTQQPPPQLAREDLAGMSPEQIVAAIDTNLCDEMLGVPPEQTALVHRARHGQLDLADVRALSALGRADLVNLAHNENRIHPNGDRP
jgi:hypothetical protein